LVTPRGTRGAPRFWVPCGPPPDSPRGCAARHDGWGRECQATREDDEETMASSPSPHASSRELRLTVQCLELYHRQGRSQKDIAKALGVSAATVSRLLKRAFDEGFVRVELDLPRTEQMEAAVAQKFGLREA